jgi:hypothetical protein
MSTGIRRLALALVATGVLAGCGTAPAPQGLCTRYDELKAAAQQLRETPKPTGGVEELRTAADELGTRVDAFLASLDQIQAVSDGRLDQAIGQARQQLDELRVQLATAGSQAAETLSAQLAQTRKDIQTTLAPVKNLLDSQCANA